MTHLAERHRGMNRHSDEVVAAVARAAVAELRRQERRPGLPVTFSGEAVRMIRSGVPPRTQYEIAAGPDDPSYGALPADRRDEDQLLWFITQALTDHAN